MALKRAREQAGMTQDEAAAVIDSASSKISRIELGQSGVRSTDLTLLTQAYRVAEDVAESLRELAKAGRQRGRWSGYRDLLPAWFRMFVVLRFDGDSASDVIYTETLTDADYIDRPDLVRAYTRLWDDLRAAALGPPVLR